MFALKKRRIEVLMEKSGKKRSRKVVVCMFMLYS